MRRKTIDALRTVSARRVGNRKAKSKRYGQDAEETYLQTTMGGKPPRHVLGASDQITKPVSKSKTKTKANPTLESVRRVMSTRKPKSSQNSHPNSKVVPQATRTIRQGLFNWDRWKGTLWHTESLPVYQMADMFKRAEWTNKQLRSLRKRQDHLPLIIHQFWRAHYHSTRLVDDTLESLNMHVIDTWVTRFLLSTAPRRITGRFLHVIDGLEQMSFGISDAMRTLYKLRRIAAHRRNNPLYFEAATNRYQALTPSRTYQASGKFNEKGSRMQRKGLTGFLEPGLYSSKNEHLAQGKVTSLNIDSFGALEQFLDSFPPRWSIEPLNSALLVLLRRLHAQVTQIDTLIAMKVRKMNGMSRFRMQEKIEDIRNAGYEIYELREEYVALCYYRLYLFPDCCSKHELGIGKELWLQLKSTTSRKGIGDDAWRVFANGSTKAVGATSLPQKSSLKKRQREANASVPAPEAAKRSSRFENDDKSEKNGVVVSTFNASTSMKLPIDELVQSQREVPLTNHRGLFTWDRWKGQDWKTESLAVYQEDLSVQVAADAHAQCQAVKARLSRGPVRQVDTFWINHYRSELVVSQRLHRFARVLSNISVIEFLLRTAPHHIRKFFSSDLATLGVLNYDFKIDLQLLRVFQITLVHLPHNPLLFKSRVMRYKMDRHSHLTRSQIQHDLKIHRHDHKAATLWDWNSRSYVLGGTERRRALKMMAMGIASSRSTEWIIHHPFVVAEPFAICVNLAMTRMRRITKLIQEIKKLYIDILSSKRWWAPQQVLLNSRQTTFRLLALNHDLTALRYHRAHQYPGSVSEEEKQRNRAFLAIVDSTLRLRNPGRTSQKHNVAPRQKQRRFPPKRVLKRSVKTTKIAITNKGIRLDLRGKKIWSHKRIEGSDDQLKLASTKASTTQSSPRPKDRMKAEHLRSAKRDLQACSASKKKFRRKSGTIDSTSTHSHPSDCDLRQSSAAINKRKHQRHGVTKVAGGSNTVTKNSPTEAESLARRLKLDKKARRK